MPARQNQNGQWIETSYFDNVGGLNNSDSPFKVKDTQATGGVNYEYSVDGAIRKRQGHDAMLTTVNVELKTRGLDIYNTTTGVKNVIRAAERKVQLVDFDTDTLTNLTQDTTTVNSDFFPASTSIPTSFAAFNTDVVSLLNFVGNTDGIYSVYSTSKVTKNGAVAPTGTISATILSTGGGFTTSGTFKYAVSYLKTGTNAESNAALDISAVVTSTADSVLLSFNTITSVDTATYNRIKLYRSAVGGADGFTSGDVVATLTLPVASYTDTGTASELSTLVPRADSVVLDNSVLPAGTYNAITLWKRRLVTATGNVLRYSELNVPESWPTVNTITIPSGGPITGLAVIAFNTDFGNDEYLAVFKEQELWLVRGNDYTDITLSFVDAVGCLNQSAITLANGYLSWIDYRGIYLWDGSGKPIYCSKPIEALFAIDGDLDKNKLPYAVSQYYRSNNQICWFVSSKIYGEQKLVIKMDLRLTLPGVESTLSGRILDGVFTLDEQDQAFYGVKAYIPTGASEERLLLGDNTGQLYSGYSVYADGGNAIDLEYYTPFMDLGTPNIPKRYKQVIVWVDEIGDWDITLDYWSGYRAALLQKSTLVAPISGTATNETALWDVAFWDQAFWDDYTPRLRGVVFNLNNSGGNSEGDCLRLRFRNSGANQPVTIHGYTVIWQQKGGNK